MRCQAGPVFLVACLCAEGFLWIFPFLFGSFSCCCAQYSRLPVVLFLLFLLCRHPDQPKLKSKRPAAAAPQQAAQQQQQEGSSAEQQLETDSEEFEPRQHSA